ncbi:hypothetical protein C8Q76DRAFT_860562 [Earliella scabrosa]|nr:hypothetical protein C8Q76DRAFT_860562 [Earliella scabrosa]
MESTHIYSVYYISPDNRRHSHRFDESLGDIQYPYIETIRDCCPVGSFTVVHNIVDNTEMITHVRTDTGWQPYNNAGFTANVVGPMRRTTLPESSPPRLEPAPALGLRRVHRGTQRVPSWSSNMSVKFDNVRLDDAERGNFANALEEAFVNNMHLLYNSDGDKLESPRKFQIHTHLPGYAHAESKQIALWKSQRGIACNITRLNLAGHVVNELKKALGQSQVIKVYDEDIPLSRVVLAEVTIVSKASVQPQFAYMVQ